jgi:hypothetical protein
VSKCTGNNIVKIEVNPLLPMQIDVDRSSIKDARTLNKLIKWVYFASVLHLVQCIFMLVASATVSSFWDFQLRVTYVHFDKQQGVPGMTSVVEDAGTIRVAPLVAMFFLLSAVFQLATVAPVCAFDKLYTTDLSRKVNQFRWYEYALSSSLMITIIALFVGISDICALLCIFSINACMNLFGLLMELENSEHERLVTWRPFVFGCVAGLPPWISIFTSLLAGSGAPGFVYAIFGSYLVLFCLFPINMALQQQRRGWWADYLFGEGVFIGLSVVAKSLLGWLVFGGLNQPNEYSGKP